MTKNYLIFRINGESMFPTLQHGDKVIVKNIALTGVKRRDIIVFAKNNKHICHRIIKKYKEGNSFSFITKGDYRRRGENVKGNQVVGKVMGGYRKGKFHSLYFKKTYFYCLYTVGISIIKVITKNVFSRLYSFRCIRTVMKTIWPFKKIIYRMGYNEGDEEFTRFLAVPPLAHHIFFTGAIAEYKGKVIAKLHVLKSNAGDYVLYSPYVRLLYRVRNVGSALLKFTAENLKKKYEAKNIYGIICDKETDDCSDGVELRKTFDRGNRVVRNAVVQCFKKAGFIIDSKKSLRVYLKYLP